MIDGRLITAALAAWLGVVAATAALGVVEPVAERHSLALAGIAAGCALAVGGAVLLVTRLVPAHRSRAVIGVAVLLAGLGATAGSWQVRLSTGPPIAEWASARVTATIDAVVTGEPIRQRSTTGGAWQSDWLQASIATIRVAARGEVFDVGVPMTVRMALDAVVPVPGSRVRLVGRLSPSRSRDVAAYVAITSARSVVIVSGPGPGDAVAHAMRIALRSAASTVAPDAGALVAGLATGDESLQTEELAADMRASGLSHLTAVSGGNLAIILTVVLAAAAVVRLSLVARVVASLAALGYFVLLVGPQPSVLRAAVMGSVVVVALLAGGRNPGPSVLATSVTMLVLVSPSLASSWGFALSVFATAGLILLAPRVEVWLDDLRAARRWPPALRRALALTVAAQVATLPLLVAMGSAVGWVSVPANLLAMPAVAPVTVGGLAAALVGPVAPSAADWLAHGAAVPAAWIAWVAHRCASLPAATLPWPSGLVGATVAVAAIVAVVLGRALLRRRFPDGVPSRARLVVVGVLAPIVLLWTLAPPSRRAWPPPGWFLIMCDVGQGDAVLLRDGPDSAVLVDAGPDPDLLDDCLDSAQVATVSAVVLTHFHADHVDGLSGAFRDRGVGPVLVSPVRDPADRAAAVDALLGSVGRPPAQAVAAGDHRRVGDVEWEALWPRRRIDAGSVPNNASVVLAVRVAGRAALLTGDIEPEAQVAVSDDLRRYRFDVVKIPHHGSRYEDPRLPAWAPAPVALVSVGAGNDYGHPAGETVARWSAIGATVMRTDESGDIAVVSVPGTSGVGLATHG